MTTIDKSAKVSRIPRFKSYEEAAEFWDTHSPEDFPDEFEDVEITFGPRPLIKRVSISAEREEFVGRLSRLPDDQRQALALSMLGLSPEEIARVMGWSATECQKALRAARRKTRTLTAPSRK